MIKIMNILIISVSFLIYSQISTPNLAVSATSISPQVSPEGNDYATQVLTNAWDMNDYKDISKYLNNSGVYINLGNVQVLNGIFSAQTQTTDGYFFLLFPGYLGGFNPGAYGENYPISSKYHCLSIRAKIESDESDEIRVFWFADSRLADGPFGVTDNFTKIIPNEWAVYNFDLNTSFDGANSNTPWAARSSWQGLRIDPTTRSFKNFAVDWVRLTDCSARFETLSWSPMNAPVEIWMGRTANSMETKIAEISEELSSYKFRIDGWEAGDYYMAVKNTSTGSTQWSQFKIAPSPKIDISKPSFISGEGLTWHMNSSEELVFGQDKTSCAISSFADGSLNLITNPPASIESECLAGGYSDPKLFFTMPVTTFNPVEYPYISYKMYTQGAWQDINKGWVGRWLWYYVKNYTLCIGVTYGISIDVNWERYSINMQDPAIGIPNYTEYCSPQPWAANTISYLRFDPNENDTTSTINQKIDWVSLNKMDKVQKGNLFTIIISPSKPIEELKLNFFYTSSLNQIPGTPITVTELPTLPNNPVQSPHNVFFPLIMNGPSSLIQDGLKYYWDTSNLATGNYYICIQSQDTTGNISLDCSEAPVQVY